MKNLASYILFITGSIHIITAMVHFISNNLSLGLIYLNFAAVFFLLGAIIRNKQK